MIDKFLQVFPSNADVYDRNAKSSGFPGPFIPVKTEIDGPRMDMEDPSVESSYRRTSLRRVANRQTGFEVL